MKIFIFDFQFENTVITRSIAFILILSHFTAVTGFNLTRHFCMGELRSVSLFSTSTSCACPTNPELLAAYDFGCCTTEKEFLQLDDDFSCTAFESLYKNLQYLVAGSVFPQIILTNFTKLIEVSQDFSQYDLPPPERIFLRIHALLIYD